MNSLISFVKVILKLVMYTIGGALGIWAFCAVMLLFGELFFKLTEHKIIMTIIILLVLWAFLR